MEPAGAKQGKDVAEMTGDEALAELPPEQQLAVKAFTSFLNKILDEARTNSSANA